MSLWKKLNPFKREVHCHVPLVAGRTSDMGVQGGVVDGIVDHPEHGETKFIEFVGVVLDSDISEKLHWEYGEVLDKAKSLIRDGVEEIRVKEEEKRALEEEEQALLEEFDPQRDMVMNMGEDGTFSFWEGDDARITAYGHRDKKEFAEEVRTYDVSCGVSETPHSEDEITHRWAVATTKHGEIGVTACDSNTPGAFPITTIWYAR